jgi:hypothetical protein
MLLWWRIGHVDPRRKKKNNKFSRRIKTPKERRAAINNLCTQQARRQAAHYPAVRSTHAEDLK